MKLFGHPLHAALVAFPLGLLLMVPIWDLSAALLGAHDAASVAYWCELMGLVLGGVAAIAGLVDLAQLSDRAAMATALQHASFALCALCLFGVAFALRGHGDPLRPLIVVLDSLGALTLSATGWLGGHLVFHHAVGIKPPPLASPTRERRRAQESYRRRKLVQRARSLFTPSRQFDIESWRALHKKSSS